MSEKSIHIDEDLHREIKIYCTEEGYTIKDFVENVLKERMENRDEENSM